MVDLMRYQSCYSLLMGVGKPPAFLFHDLCVCVYPVFFSSFPLFPYQTVESCSKVDGYITRLVIPLVCKLVFQPDLTVWGRGFFLSEPEGRTCG
jgi:hypothetical protein